MTELDRITDIAKSVGAENPRTPCARGSQDISEKDSMKMLKEKLIVQECLILEWDKDHLSDRNCIESIKELWATSQKELLAFEQAILAKRDEELQREKDRLNERIDFWKAECNKHLVENAELKQAAKDDAQNILTLIKQLRYCVGIAERGRNETMPEDVTPEVYLLEYVKGLECIIAESKEQKPVAYRHFSSKWSEWHYEDTPFVGRTSEPLYTSPPIQDGMVAVPVEPTEKMLNSQPHAWPDDAREIWKAMIEASKENSNGAR